MKTRALFTAVTLLACANVLIAQKADTLGVSRAIVDIGRTWENQGIGAALDLCRVAEKTFPESAGITLTACILLETDGQAEAALKRYDGLIERAGEDVHPWSPMKIKDVLSLPRSRLLAQLGRHREALDLLTSWRLGLPVDPKRDPREQVDFATAVMLMGEASLMADGLNDPYMAAERLRQAEQLLRPQYVMIEGTPLDQIGTRGLCAWIGYRRCVHEFERLSKLAMATKPVAVPAGMRTPPPMDIEWLLNRPTAVQFYSIFACGEFIVPPEFAAVCPQAENRWMRRVSAHAVSSEQRAVCGFLAGLYALQQEDTAGALEGFEASARSESWLSPASAVACARVAVGLADKGLEEAAKRHPQDTNSLKSIRQKLSTELGQSAVTPLPVR